MIDVILTLTWAFLISVFAIPSIIYVAQTKQILNLPNERSSHTQSLPRLGGLAIFAGFLSAVTLFGYTNNGIQYILAGCVIMFFIGLKDDIVNVSAFKKFFVQMLATGILVFMGDFRVTDFKGLLGIHELTPGISYAFSMVVIIALTNSINLIDGIDGLAGSILVFISGILCGFFYLSDNSVFRPYANVSAALAGSVLGFLRYNFTKAKIFMGDTGSLVCGLIISALIIKFIEYSPLAYTSAFAVCLVIIPILDTLRVTIIRIMQGRSPFSPDKNHIHHRMLAMGLSQLQTVLVLILFNASIVLLLILLDFSSVNRSFAFILGIMVCAASVLYVYKGDILS